MCPHSHVSSFKLDIDLTEFGASLLKLSGNFLFGSYRSTGIATLQLKSKFIKKHIVQHEVFM
jgi:hypothetical protein